MKLSKSILSIYIQKHVQKTNTNIPFYFKRIIYELHGEFMKTHEQTNIYKIVNLLLRLEAKEVCFAHTQWKKEFENKNQNMDIVETNT